MHTEGHKSGHDFSLLKHPHPHQVNVESLNYSLKPITPLRQLLLHATEPQLVSIQYRVGQKVQFTAAELA